jgi:glycosyltransferase involved in cell wall biosynthesis
MKGNIFLFEVFLPIYNEEKVIGKSIDIIRAFSDKNPDYCFTFVDDGSNDKTPEILAGKIENNQGDSIRYRLNPVNRGKGYALTRCLCSPRAKSRVHRW